MTELKILINKILILFLIFFTCLNFFWYILNENSRPFKLDHDPLDVYIKLHNSIRKDNSHKIVSCRGIRPGYANKIYNVLSALCIAILTNSSISIVWPEIEQFVQPPLKNIFQEPRLIKPKKISSSSSNTWRYRKKLDGLLNKKISNGSHLIFQANKAFFFDISPNPEHYPQLLSYNLVRSETIEDAKENLRQKLNNVEPFLSIGFEVGHRLMQKFWILSPNFTRIVQDFYEKNFKGFYVIGIQIRTKFLKKNDTDLRSFMSCAIQIENMVQKNVTFKWFVTSDSVYAARRIRKFYPKRVIEGVGKLGHIRFNKQAYFRTVMDSELLAKSDEIVITGGSTYGFVSSIRKGTLPFYIDGVDFNYPCRRMNFSYLPRSKYGSAIF